MNILFIQTFSAKQLRKEVIGIEINTGIILNHLAEMLSL